MTNFPLATQIYISISECFSSPKPVKSNHILDISSWTFQTDFKLNSRFSLSACLSSKPTMSCNIIYSLTDASEPGVIFDISSYVPPTTKPADFISSISVQSIHSPLVPAALQSPPDRCSTVTGTAPPHPVHSPYGTQSNVFKAQIWCNTSHRKNNIRKTVKTNKKKTESFQLFPLGTGTKTNLKLAFEIRPHLLALTSTALAWLPLTTGEGITHCMFLPLPRIRLPLSLPQLIHTHTFSLFPLPRKPSLTPWLHQIPQHRFSEHLFLSSTTPARDI